MAAGISWSPKYSHAFQVFLGVVQKAKQHSFTLSGPEDQSGFWSFRYLKSHSKWEVNADAHIPAIIILKTG